MGAIFTLYINELPRLHKIMYDTICTWITDRPTLVDYKYKYNTIKYDVDSATIIFTNDNTYLTNYIDNHYLLLESYHNIAYLKVDGDKTKFMISCQPKFINSIRNIIMNLNT